jgi:hypothetical protein
MKCPSTQFCWVSNFDQSSFGLKLYVKQSGERNLGQAARKQEKRPTEDEIARAHLGDRGVPGEPFPINEMTPERKKKTPLYGLDPGHTA